MKPFWISVLGDDLPQGDLLLECPVPVFPENYGEVDGSASVDILSGNLIVVTQSCDLANDKVDHVSLCPIHSLRELAEIDKKSVSTDFRESIRQGRIEALHMLATPGDQTNLEGVLVIDFRRIISLPIGYLKKHAGRTGPRWRLESPYLEHFSQAFARFFMRVGLPSSIPSFKAKK